MPRASPRRTGGRPRYTLRTGSSASRAESQARDSNLKLQLQLTRQLLRSDRDSQAGAREAERRERDLLLDLARILDSKLSPSIDEWFERRRVVQTSRLPDTWTTDQMLARLAKPSSTPDETSSGRGAVQTFGIPAEAFAWSSSAALQFPASSEAADRRQRVLEVKRADWFGFTSVPMSFGPRPLEQRPQTAVATLDRKEGRDDEEPGAMMGGGGDGEASAHHRRASTPYNGSVSSGSHQRSKQMQRNRPKSASAHLTLRTA